MCGAELRYGRVGAWVGGLSFYQAGGLCNVGVVLS